MLTRHKRMHQYLLASRLSLCCLVFFGIFSACGRQTPTVTPEPTPEKKGSITIWGWDDQAMTPLLPQFNALYPDIAVNYVNFPSDDECMDTFKSAYATGEPLPDIMWIENQRMGEFFALDIWVALDVAPYNMDKSLVVSSFLPSITNEEGEIVGLRWDFSIAGLAYRQDVAEKYLGTGDPDELEALLSTWDAFMAKGLEVQEMSGGEVFMFSSLKDAFRVIDGQDPKPLLAGDALNLTGTLDEIYRKLVEMRDLGIADTLVQWSAEWNVAIAGGKHIFYPAPVWFPHFVIEPNDPEGVGQWRMINPPGGGFFWGGTTLSIPQRSENKELAWTFLEWYLLTSEGAFANKEASGMFIPFRPIYDDATYVAYTQPWFGDQDLGQKWFQDIASQSNDVKPPTAYDTELAGIHDLIIDTISVDRTIGVEGTLELLRTEIQAKFPEVELQ